MRYNMINVLINGISGKMGQVVLHQIEASDKFTCIAGVNRSNNIYDIKTTPNVIIDFSVPEATLSMLKYAQEKHVPVVIATTGFSDKQFNIIKGYSKKIPVFISANMSYETNLMISLVSRLAKELNDSDIEIVEAHHNKKLDAPSGTALMIAEGINNFLDNSMNYEFYRHSKHSIRSKKEIGIHSLRGGTEIGKHSVFFFGNNESLEITHTVTSRTVFANGALKAAEFIINKPAGLYNMDNLINKS